jgi:arginyl-tRNA--protein-N-Asp/Glu arginylyltransferase
MGLEWYYLGFYVRDCSHLAYKAGYLPHERRIGGVWVPSDTDGSAPPGP